MYRDEIIRNAAENCHILDVLHMVIQKNKTSVKK